MLVPGVRQNRSLARAVNWRMRAAAFSEAGQGVMLRLGGVAILAAGMGVGAGAALYGAAQLNAQPSEAAAIASAIERRLNGMSIHARGEVALAQGAPNLTLAMGGAVGMSPDARLRAEGMVGTREEPLFPKLPEPRQQAAGDAPVVTNYTIFKSVRFGSGNVQTGWNFVSSQNTRPDMQYCYYAEPVAGSVESLRIDLGVDGRRAAAPTRRAGFDAQAAFASCVWFPG